MAGGSAIRGSRVGAGPMGEAERVMLHRDSMSPITVHRVMKPARIRGGCLDPGRLGLSAMRFAGESRFAESAAAAEDRAVQDTPGLRQGTPHRQRGGRHLDRGAARRSAPAAPAAK